MKRLALILVTALLLASLPISIATAEDCQIKYMLVDEQVSEGEFIRVYKTLDDCGYGLESSLQQLSGVSGNTPYEAKMEIIERGLGRFLMLPPETVVSEDLLRRWQEEGYRPEWEFKDFASAFGYNNDDSANVEDTSSPDNHETINEEEHPNSPTQSSEQIEQPSLDSSKPLAKYKDPTSAIALTEEREAELREQLANDTTSENQNLTADTPNATWWQRLLLWLKNLIARVIDWFTDLFGKEDA